MKQFGGNVLFLDRSDINTDEIIPAKYLTENTKEALKPHLLEDLKLDRFDPATDLHDIQVIITRDNFGCGSSREHAPWALEVNGIFVVVAVSFARIFRQNMFNRGMLAVELPKDEIDEIMSTFNSTKGKTCTAGTCKAEVDLEAKRIAFSSGEKELTYPLAVSDFDLALVGAGGWVEYADKKY